VVVAVLLLQVLQIQAVVEVLIGLMLTTSMAKTAAQVL
jgi:hypothetical protein